MIEPRWEPVEPRRVLALDPGQRGIAFALVQIDPLRLLEFGTKKCRVSERALRLDKATKLVDVYQPEVVVLEDWRQASRLRRNALRPFAVAFETEMIDRDVPVVQYSSSRVRNLFRPMGARTKTDIARALAIRFPELIWRVPPVRKIWMSEDDQMGVFDSIALALTHLDEEGHRLTVNGP